MELFKKYWDKLLIIFGALAAGAFFIARIFLVKKEIGHEDFPQAEKKRLEGEKKALEQSQSDLDTKVYSDKEIEDKFNEK